jgi:hypothetical protein
MFVGHYGPSLAAKALKKTTPLWVLFIAVQLLDVLWSIFVLFGIEKVRIVPGLTATNPLDLYYMPYTHSLIGSMLWAIATSIAYYVFRKIDGLAARHPQIGPLRSLHLSFISASLPSPIGWKESVSSLAPAPCTLP